MRLSPQVGVAVCLLGAILPASNGQAQTPASNGAPERLSEDAAKAGDATTPPAPAAETPATQAPTTDAPTDGTPVGEAPAAETPVTQTPAISPAPGAPADKTQLLPGMPQESRLYADTLTKEGDVYIAEGSPVRFVGPEFRITAKLIRLNAALLTVKAEGEVVIERDRDIVRRELRPSSLSERASKERITETLRGSNFQYNYTTREGKLDQASVRLAGFNVSTVSLIIKGQRYTAHNVVLRPGGLSEEDEKIYGKPPPNIRARTVTVNAGTPNARAIVTGAALYWKNTRLIPVPSYILRSGGGLNSREDKAFQITPRISYNSTDGALITTSLRFPLSSSRPEKFGLSTDLGISTRIGFRGGASLDAQTRFGTFALRGRLSDIVTTQLTNRIELNRSPELEFGSALFPLFDLPGKRRAGFVIGLGSGRFSERTIGDNAATVRSTRNQAAISVTTRYFDVDGPYAELFARAAHYSNADTTYRNAGFEIGYQGSLTRFIRGQFSYRSTKISGSTPFIFDRIEIAKEVRTTFDILPSRRYIIPIDLRYDLDLKQLRDERVGLLRSYGIFAYGFTYQTARHELKFELRRGF